MPDVHLLRRLVELDNLLPCAARNVDGNYVRWDDGERTLETNIAPAGVFVGVVIPRALPVARDAAAGMRVASGKSQRSCGEEILYSDSSVQVVEPAVTFHAFRPGGNMDMATGSAKEDA